jgi:hypothetical protein
VTPTEPARSHDPAVLLGPAITARLRGELESYLFAAEQIRGRPTGGRPIMLMLEAVGIDGNTTS